MSDDWGTFQIDTEEKNQEIHTIKKYFAERGIPIILPLSTKDGRTFFFCDDFYYALFPYIEGRQLERKQLTETALQSLGEMLGKIHLAGKNATALITEKFKEWDKDKLLARSNELLEIIANKEIHDDFDEAAKKDLLLRASIIEANTRTFQSFGLVNDHLIHGDYHAGNVFFDEHDHVPHVFDLEKSIYAPRIFELFRSLVFICFGDAFTDEHIQNARLYLQSYLRVYPATREELQAGFTVFFLRFVHGFWVANEHYLKGNTRVDQFLVQDYHRISYLSNHLSELFIQLTE